MVFASSPIVQQSVISLAPLYPEKLFSFGAVPFNSEEQKYPSSHSCLFGKLSSFTKRADQHVSHSDGRCYIVLTSNMASNSSDKSDERKKSIEEVIRKLSSGKSDSVKDDINISDSGTCKQDEKLRRMAKRRCSIGNIDNYRSKYCSSPTERIGLSPDINPKVMAVLIPHATTALLGSSPLRRRSVDAAGDNFEDDYTAVLRKIVSNPTGSPISSAPSTPYSNRSILETLEKDKEVASRTQPEINIIQPAPNESHDVRMTSGIEHLPSFTEKIGSFSRPSSLYLGVPSDSKQSSKLHLRNKFAKTLSVKREEEEFDISDDECPSHKMNRNQCSLLDLPANKSRSLSPIQQSCSSGSVSPVSIEYQNSEISDSKCKEKIPCSDANLFEINCDLEDVPRLVDSRNKDSYGEDVILGSKPIASGSVEVIPADNLENTSHVPQTLECDEKYAEHATPADEINNFEGKSDLTGELNIKSLLPEHVDPIAGDKNQCEEDFNSIEDLCSPRKLSDDAGFTSVYLATFVLGHSIVNRCFPSKGEILVQSSPYQEPQLPVHSFQSKYVDCQEKKLVHQMSRQDSEGCDQHAGSVLSKCPRRPSHNSLRSALHYLHRQNALSFLLLLTLFLPVAMMALALDISAYVFSLLQKVMPKNVRSSPSCFLRKLGIQNYGSSSSISSSANRPCPILLANNRNQYIVGLSDFLP